MLKIDINTSWSIGRLFLIPPAQSYYRSKRGQYMKRRNFLSTLAVSSGAMMSGARCNNESSRKITTEIPQERTGSTILEPAREIPIIEEPDVLVVGGGPAGVAAAIAAGRAGASTVLVERYNHLGGLWTGGLVLPLLSTHAVDKRGRQQQVIFGVGDEMVQRLRQIKMVISEVNPVVDPEAAKYLFDVMIKESSVKMLYHCWASNVIVEDGWIKAVILETKSGRVAIAPKMVVDGTGDGDILHLAGENYDNMKYHIGLVHRLGNVDRIDPSKPGFKKLQIGDSTPIPSVNWFNMHGDDDRDGIDLHTLSQLQQKYRIQIWENTEKIRATPGYEEVFLLDTASQLGVRMSRILDGEYRLTLEDSMTFKQFDDVIGISGAWTNMLYDGKRIRASERPLWQIPYRSMLPRKTKNLIVSGRCFCFERGLVEDTRIIGTCLVTGHGAGAAAAVAAQSNSSAKMVDIQKVQSLLRQQKANLG
jgi:ribulose 1,5-bisphosphate synthetase/thiazole synthase